jgi:hypothetical protein
VQLRAAQGRPGGEHAGEQGEGQSDRHENRPRTNGGTPFRCAPARSATGIPRRSRTARPAAGVPGARHSPRSSRQWSIRRSARRNPRPDRRRTTAAVSPPGPRNRSRRRCSRRPRSAGTAGPGRSRRPGPSSVASPGAGTAAAPRAARRSRPRRIRRRPARASAAAGFSGRARETAAGWAPGPAVADVDQVDVVPSRAGQQPWQRPRPAGRQQVGHGGAHGGPLVAETPFLIGHFGEYRVHVGPAGRLVETGQKLRACSSSTARAAGR